jgi:hypothetical protein
MAQGNGLGVAQHHQALNQALWAKGAGEGIRRGGAVGRRELKNVGVRRGVFEWMDGIDHDNIRYTRIRREMVTRMGDGRFQRAAHRSGGAMDGKAHYWFDSGGLSSFKMTTCAGFLGVFGSVMAADFSGVMVESHALTSRLMPITKASKVMAKRPSSCQARVVGGVLVCGANSAVIGGMFSGTLWGMICTLALENCAGRRMIFGRA